MENLSSSASASRPATTPRGRAWTSSRPSSRTVEGLEGYKFGIVASPPTRSAGRRSSCRRTSSTRRARSTSSRSWSPRWHSKIELQRAGSPAQRTWVRKTNTWGALSLALGIAEKGKKDEEYLSAGHRLLPLRRTPDPRRHRHQGHPRPEANRLRKVVLHAIAIGDFSKAFMEQLAGRNGGTFVDPGRTLPRGAVSAEPPWKGRPGARRPPGGVRSPRGKAPGARLTPGRPYRFRRSKRRGVAQFAGACLDAEAGGSTLSPRPPPLLRSHGQRRVAGFCGGGRPAAPGGQRRGSEHHPGTCEGDSRPLSRQ